jgi:hypothetical protein
MNETESNDYTIEQQDKAADEYLALVEARKSMRRLTKNEKQAIALSCAGAWIRWAADKIAEGQDPVKFSLVVRDYVLASIDDHPIYREMNYYIPPSTITRICKLAVSNALEMLSPQTRYQSVRKHFQK